MTALHPIAHRLATVAALLLPCGLAMAGTVQLTSGASSFNSFGSSVSDDGRRVAFYSASNLTGQNGDNSFEIYVYDRGTGALSQVSRFDGGHLAGGNQAPVISGDGTRISYQHFRTSGGTATFQSLLFDASTGQTTTLTPMSLFGETNELSRDGRTVAIATGNTGLRLYDVAGNTLGPVIAGNTFNTAMSRDGRQLALEFFGRLELRDLDGGTTRNVTPAGSGPNMRPDLSDDGRWLAFTATFDPLGRNADHNDEVFVYDTVSGSIRQVTRSTGGFGTNSDVSISADGTRIAFNSTADLVGRNADLNQEIFVYDLVDDRLTQVTETLGSFSMEPSLSGDGRWLSFTSSADLTGENRSGAPQIFLTELAPTSAPVPEPAPWLMAGLGLAALMRRRSVQQARRPGPSFNPRI